MIEITIPLNLPIRAVEVTATTAEPSDRIKREITRKVEGHLNKSAVRNHSDVSGDSVGSRTDIGSVQFEQELQQERDGLRNQRALLAETIRELQRASRAIDQQLAGLIPQLQIAAVELGHVIAAKLIFEEVDKNRFPVANLVHEVVGRLDTQAKSTIRLHPDDLALIQDLPEIAGGDEERSISFVADSTLNRGDCKAKAGEITVSYELQRQIEEIRRQLLSTVSGHAEA